MQPRSPNETDCLLSAFHRGWQTQISHQLSAMRAELRSGQDRLQATSDRHLVYTGQIMEAQRQLMAKLETAPSGPPILKQIKEVLNFLGAVYKAWPVIRWAIALNTFGWLAKHAARLLGWL